MSTTSLKVSEEVKQLAASTAKYQGLTPDAFRMDAIRLTATATDQRAQFVVNAVASRVDVIVSGKAYSAGEVHAYLRAKVRGLAAAKPRVKLHKLGRSIA